MKKTLFALMACAAVLPAMAGENWLISTAKAGVCDLDSTPGHYTFYVYYSPTSITSASTVTETLESLTFSQFEISENITLLGSSSAASAGKQGVKDIITWSNLQTSVPTASATPATDLWGVCVWQNEDAAKFQVIKATNAQLVSGTYTYTSTSTSYASFSPETQAPEPATATLSLLALAGLAARRRRH